MTNTQNAHEERVERDWLQLVAWLALGVITFPASGRIAVELWANPEVKDVWHWLCFVSGGAMVDAVLLGVLAWFRKNSSAELVSRIFYAVIAWFMYIILLGIALAGGEGAKGLLFRAVIGIDVARQTFPSIAQEWQRRRSERMTETAPEQHRIARRIARGMTFIGRVMTERAIIRAELKAYKKAQTAEEALVKRVADAVEIVQNELEREGMLARMRHDATIRQIQREKVQAEVETLRLGAQWDTVDAHGEQIGQQAAREMQQELHIVHDDLHRIVQHGRGYAITCNGGYAQAADGSGMLHYGTYEKASKAIGGHVNGCKNAAAKRNGTRMLGA
jgi:hypothetical protein